jgi:hypothetical protein
MFATVAEIINENLMMTEWWVKVTLYAPQPFYCRDIKHYF